MPARRIARILLTSFACIVTGCGGGGGSSANVGILPTAPAPQATTATASAGTAQLTLTIPLTNAQSAARSTQYISPATNSLSIAINGGTPTTISLATYPGCSNTVTGRTCQIALSLPAGRASYQVRMFASTDATGLPLSIGSGTVNITPNVDNPVTLTLHAILNTVRVTLTPALLVGGQPATGTVTVTALDAANSAIPLGSSILVDANDVAVSLSMSDIDASGTVSLAPLANGASSTAFSYSGASIPASVSITAKAETVTNSNLASASATLDFSAPGVVPTPAPTPGPVVALPSALTFNDAVSTQSVTLSQTNDPSGFHATLVGGDPSCMTFAINGSTLTVTAVHAGATNIVITGSGGQSVTLPVSVTTTSVTLS